MKTKYHFHLLAQIIFKKYNSWILHILWKYKWSTGDGDWGGKNYFKRISWRALCWESHTCTHARTHRRPVKVGCQCLPNNLSLVKGISTGGLRKLDMRPLQLEEGSAGGWYLFPWTRGQVKPMDPLGGWEQESWPSKRHSREASNRYMKVPIRESALNISCAMRSTRPFYDSTS